MEDGFIEPADRGEVRVDVKRVEVAGQAVQSSLQRWKDDVKLIFGIITFWFNIVWHYQIIKSANRPY